MINPMTTHVADHGHRYHEFGLPDRLRAAREQAGLSQSALATLTGISLKSITRYETGETVPRRPQLVVWGLATGFSVDWLDSGKAPSPPSSDGDGIAVTGEYNHIPHRQVTALPVSHLQTAAYNTAASLAMLPGAA